MSVLTINPTSGSGIGTINIKADSTTGRNEIKANVKVTTDAGESITIPVTRSGKDGFLTFTSEREIEGENKVGSSIIFEGYSNFAAPIVITGFYNGDVSINQDDYVTVTMEIETADGKIINYKPDGNEVIEGDPGAEAQYKFKIICTVIKEIDTIQDSSGENVKGHCFLYYIYANFDDAKLYDNVYSKIWPRFWDDLAANPSSVTIDSEGNEEEVTIKSSTNWTATEEE